MIKWAILGVATLGILAAMLNGLSVFMDDDPAVVRIPYDDPAAVKRGKSVYAAACASCHGAKLEGQPNWRQRKPDGRLPAPPHDETGHTWHHPDGQLFDITKYGTAAYAPEGYQTDMIGFGDILSDAEILDSLAYIKASWPNEVQSRHTALMEAQR